MVKIKVKIGTLVLKGKHYQKGNEIEVDKKTLEKLDPRDYEIVEKKEKG